MFISPLIVPCSTRPAKTLYTLKATITIGHDGSRRAQFTPMKLTEANPFVMSRSARCLTKGVHPLPGSLLKRVPDRRLAQPQMRSQEAGQIGGGVNRRLRRRQDSTPAGIRNLMVRRAGRKGRFRGRSGNGK